MSFRIPRRDTELRFVTKFGENQPLQSCRKDLWITTQKTRADSFQSPFCPKWADRDQNSLNFVTPWRVHVYRIWSWSAALCRTYSGKIDFSAPKVITIIGFQPTIKAMGTQRKNTMENKQRTKTKLFKLYKWGMSLIVLFRSTRSKIMFMFRVYSRSFLFNLNICACAERVLWSPLCVSVSVCPFVANALMDVDQWARVDP